VLGDARARHALASTEPFLDEYNGYPSAVTNLFDTGLCAALDLDRDGTIRRASPGWRTILAWDPESLVGRPLPQLCRARHRERFTKALSNIAQGAPSAIVRGRFPHGPAEHELMVRLEPVGDRIFATAEDVGVRTAVLPTGSQLQSLVDFATEAWFVHDLEGRIRDANPWAYRSLGYTRDEMLELHVSDFEKSIQPGRLDGVWNRMEVGKPITVEGCHIHKDGHEIPVEVRLGLFTTEEDEVLLLAVARDVTERKKQQAELEALAARMQSLNEHLEEEVARRAGELRVLIDNLADGLFAEDMQGNVQASNPALMDLLDLSESPTGHTTEETLPPSLAELGRACIEEGEVRKVEITLTRKRVGLAVASPVLNEDSTLGAVTLVRDITLEKEIDSMKTNFIAMVSHELRTPLTSVLGFAKLTRNKFDKSISPALPTDSKSVARAAKMVRGNIDIIVSEGERLTHLIDDVLDIAKMEAGRVDWQMEPTDPLGLLEQAMATCASLFVEGGPVAFERDFEDDLPQITADADRLLQVMLNLVSNAVKFTEEGFIRVTARACSSGLEVAVRDSGAGIDPSLHELVFERFKQVGDTLTGKPKGTGLGLPITRQIVEAHGGRIWLESELGVGTAFLFTIPANEVRTPVARERRSSNPPINVDGLVQRIEREAIHRNVAGRDVLVVDDDPSLRELLRQQLTERGFAVRLAQDGFEAIEAVRSRRPDLVILDVMMPGLSGFDVAALLKNDPSTESIPIVILTIVADEQRGLRLGVDRYLTKPMEADQLVGTVQELINNGGSPRRVLVVDRDDSASSDVTRMLTAKGYEVVGTCTGQEAIALARERRPDLILVEALVQDHAELVRAIRFERDLEHVLVIQLMDEE